LVAAAATDWIVSLLDNDKEEDESDEMPSPPIAPSKNCSCTNARLALPQNQFMVLESCCVGSNTKVCFDASADPFSRALTAAAAEDDPLPLDCKRSNKTTLA